MSRKATLTANIDLQISTSDELEVAVEIHNSLGEALPNWVFHFDLPKIISSSGDTRIDSQAGSHVCLRAKDNALFASGECQTLRFKGQPAIIQRLTDLPDGMYIQSQGKCIEVNTGKHNLADLFASTSSDFGSSPSAASKHAKALPDAPTLQSSLAGNCPIIPMPAMVRTGTGRYLCKESFAVQALPEADHAIIWLRANMPPGIVVSQQTAAAADLQFQVDGSLADEAYGLSVQSDKIVVSAAGRAGFFHAIVSLVQLIPAGAANSLELPCLEIEDFPRFEYRGLMLDCARHFHSKDAVLKILDLMALYKLNHFHWHLTDDEGWRIEINAFPELTVLGAWRGEGEVLESQFGSGPNRYGGFYSREDIAEVIHHATLLGITVVPEIDVPGHSRAAIKSLPEFLVESGDSSEYLSEQLYNDNVLNPALPGTYHFIHAVLDEVCELFPGPYVHIGADEVPSGVWNQSPACNALMEQQGYQSAIDLQGHLLRNLQEYLANKGKQLIGWEEAAHGDKLDHAAIICAWSSPASATECTHTGYRVIACPAPYAYLDLAWNSDPTEPGFYWAGTASLDACYAYDPRGETGTEQTDEKILGVQAVLWSELIASQERLEYMLFPRALAIAETGWSQYGHKDWKNFKQRVNKQLPLLDQRGVNHRSLENDD